MSEFSVRADSVNVEEVMRQIRQLAEAREAENLFTGSGGAEETDHPHNGNRAGT